MDDKRFDALTVSISRRQSLRLGSAALAAMGAASVTPNGAVEAKKRRCKNLRQSCSNNGQCCGYPERLCGDNDISTVCCIAPDAYGCADDDFNCCNAGDLTGFCIDGYCRLLKRVGESCTSSSQCHLSDIGAVTCSTVNSCGYTTKVCCTREDWSCESDCECCGDRTCVDGYCE